jgi:hypothetical protein
VAVLRIEGISMERRRKEAPIPRTRTTVGTWGPDWPLRMVVLVSMSLHQRRLFQIPLSFPAAYASATNPPNTDHAMERCVHQLINSTASLHPTSQHPAKVLTLARFLRGSAGSSRRGIERYASACIPATAVSAYAAVGLSCHFCLMQITSSTHRPVSSIHIFTRWSQLCQMASGATYNTRPQHHEKAYGKCSQKNTPFTFSLVFLRELLGAFLGNRHTATLSSNRRDG